MVKWEIAMCSWSNTGHLQEYLDQGWEPFAATCLGNPGFAVVWLRRKVKQ